MNTTNKEVLLAIEKILDDNNIKYSISNIEKKNFIDDKMYIFGKRKLMISHSETENADKVCSLINRQIIPNGYHVTKDDYNTLYLSSLNESSENLYHLSEYEGIKELHPSIPSNFLTKNGYEENKTPRVCFTNSIDKCLTALSENCENKKYYIYTPDGDYDIYTPSISEVPDRNITGEVWIKESVKVKCIGKILCTGSYGGPLKYKYGNNTAELFKWKYKNIPLDESSVIYENDELIIPEKYDENINIENDNLITLLNNTDHKKIYFTSDWHLFQTHYKNEKNYVNTQKIVTWCRQNIKDNDIFMYLGDICFRYANKEDQLKAAEIINSLPGIKVLIVGNHDLMLGDDFINKCGFKYVFTEYKWNDLALIFTHRPIRMEEQPSGYWNIHGHIHKWTGYNTTDGKKNINVYPYFYDNKPVTLDYLLNHKEELVKDNYWNNNAMLSETKRSELDDSQFGIPEDRKYPLDTKQHVSSAIKLFGHAEESKKKKLAKNIAAAAKKYDLSIPETTQCYKYLQEGGLQDMIPSDIKNIVFDFGSVLVESDLEGTYHNGLAVSHLMSHEIQDSLYEIIFNNKELKSKNKSLEEIKEYFIKNAPSNILPFTDKIFSLLKDALHKCDYTDYLINTIRSNGYSIYYLSNWDKWSYDIEKEFFDKFTNKFDGGLFSFESRYEKPDINFYQEFFDKFNLDPQSCFFFDDKSENITAAEHLGMRGMVFNSNETPKLLLIDNFNIPSDGNNTELINNNININEWSMASCNPIIGIKKPFILKVSDDSGSIINTKQFLFSPDIISDKYLAISEDAKLEIVDASNYDDYYVEIYEYIGNKSRLNKLNEVYKSGKIVDNTVFYTILTGKPMLCEDQIDFDPDFKKVDIDLIQESIISEMVTLRDDFLKINNINTSILVNENYIVKPDYLYNYSDIIIKEDLDGYYLYNNLTKKRSGSEKNIYDLSESMIKSII